MRQLVYLKENSEFKPVKLRLKIDPVSYKKNDLVSYPVRAEGLGKYDEPIDYIIEGLLTVYTCVMNDTLRLIFHLKNKGSFITRFLFL